MGSSPGPVSPTLRPRPGTGRVAALLALALLGGPWAAERAQAQSWRTVTMSRQQAGEAAMVVDVQFGSGRFDVHPSEEGLLYRMELRYDEEVFEPRLDYGAGELDVRVERVGSGFQLTRDHSRGELDLGLSRDVVLDLNMEFGAVRADIELGGLSVSELALSTGASESTIRVSEPNPEPMRRARIEAGAARFDAHSLGNLNAERISVDAGLGDVTLRFDGEWRRDARLDVDMGMGSLDLRFPRGLGVRLVLDSFLTSLDPQGLLKEGEAYYSPDWEEAERRIDVRIDSAVGRVNVGWLP